jgi:hypothetical protein
MPSNRGHGEERITSDCAGCGEDRGEHTIKTKGRPKRKDPVTFPKNNGTFEAKTASPEQLNKVAEAAPVIHTHPHPRTCRHCGLVNGGNAVVCMDCQEPLRAARNTATIEA